MRNRKRSGFYLQISSGLKAVIPYAAVFAFFGYALFEAIPHPLIQGDSNLLIQGDQAILHCLKVGQWRNCAGVDEFPILQHLVSLTLEAVGLSNRNAKFGLVWVSLISFIFVTLEVWRLLIKKSKLTCFVALSVLMSSYLIWYSFNSFGEMLASAVTIAFISSILSNSIFSAAIAVFLRAYPRRRRFCLFSF